MEESKLKLLPEENLVTAADAIKILAHPLRLRIMDIITQGEYAVYEIAEICDTTPPIVCEHLRLMKRNNILESKRKGKTVYYRIIKSPTPEFLKILNKFL